MRRANGTGSVYMLRGNRRKPWAARITVECNIAGDGTLKQRYKHLGTFPTRLEAETALDCYLQQNSYDIAEVQGSTMERKPSEIVTDFLKFMEQSSKKYEAANADVGREDSKVQTFLHDMEFASNENERDRIAALLQRSRRERRKAKDIAQLYENIHNFYTDKQNQNILKALRRLQNEQITLEMYLSIMQPEELK